MGANVDLAILRLRTHRPHADPGLLVDEVVALLLEAAEGVQAARAAVRDLASVAPGPRTADDAPVPVSPTRALTWVLSVARRSAEGIATVESSVPALPDVLGDHGRLGRLFLTIIDAAVVCFPAPDPARNRVRVTAEFDAKHVCVRVVDNGPAVDVAALELAAEPYTPLRHEPVGGVAYAQAARTLRELGGSLSLRPAGPEGLCAELSLPRARRDGAARRPSARGPGVSGRRPPRS